MNLKQTVTNPEAIERVFGDSPSLENVSIHEIGLHRDGPRVTLRFDVPEYPKNPPAKWKAQGFNRVQITLACLATRGVRCDGWSTSNKASIVLSRDDAGKLLVRIVGDTTHLELICDHVFVENLSAYKDTGEESEPLPRVHVR